MTEKPTLVAQTTLFGRVVAYECTACGKSFAMALLDGAVPSDAPAPYIVPVRHSVHTFAKIRTNNSRSEVREIRMVADDDDLPLRYLFYAVAVIVVIAAI